mgnify:CR=1 FL=1
MTNEEMEIADICLFTVNYPGEILIYDNILQKLPRIITREIFGLIFQKIIL